MVARHWDLLTDWLTVSRNVTLTLEATKLKPSAWAYNWASLFLGDINAGTWPSRLEESRFWDSKIWSWVPRDSDMRMSALARASSNCKRQTRHLVRDGAPIQQARNCLTVTKIWSWAPDRCLTLDRLADWPSAVTWLWLWLELRQSES
jgi:hypothetical protein